MTHIITHETDHILTIQFNRPHKKNAMTLAMYQHIAQVLADANSREDVRVVVLTGCADIFTAGNDLEDFLSQSTVNTPLPTTLREGPFAPIGQFMQGISTFAKPILAAVSGPAVGIGTTLLLHCDMVYASKNASFSMPFTQLGLCAECGSSFLLPRTIGYHLAAEKLLLGESFTAEAAHAMGMVNQVLPPETLLDYTYQQAKKLAHLPVDAVRTTKALMKAPWQKDIDQVMAEEAAQFQRLLASQESKKALTAFLKK